MAGGNDEREQTLNQLLTEMDGFEGNNGTLDSPATAFASMVLPVPGGPTSRTPFGMEAPTLVYFSGLCR